MHVLTVPQLLKLSVLPSHEEAIDHGVLRVKEDDDPAIFISHQWARDAHPDQDDAQKLRSVQAALAALCEGRVQEAFSTAEDCANCMRHAESALADVLKG